MTAICNANIERLREIGIKKGFGQDNRKRLHCYSILLGCGDIEIYRKSDKYKDNFKYKNNYSQQIAKDLKRNAYYRWSETSKYCASQPNQQEHDLSQIGKLLNIVFAEYPQLDYIQSFDSIFTLFYLLSGRNLFVAKKIICNYFHIFKADVATKSDGFGHFKAETIFDLINKYDSAFYEWWKQKIMKNIDHELCIVFALKWYLSWFCHSALTDVNDILRIYDYMISSQSETICIYMIVAVLLLNKNRIMTHVHDYPELLIFIKESMVYDVNQMIAQCNDILNNENDENVVQKMWMMLSHSIKKAL